MTKKTMKDYSPQAIVAMIADAMSRAMDLLPPLGRRGPDPALVAELRAAGLDPRLLGVDERLCYYHNREIAFGCAVEARVQVADLYEDRFEPSCTLNTGSAGSMTPSQAVAKSSLMLEVATKLAQVDVAVRDVHFPAVTSVEDRRVFRAAAEAYLAPVHEVARAYHERREAAGKS